MRKRIRHASFYIPRCDSHSFSDWPGESTKDLFQAAWPGFVRPLPGTETTRNVWKVTHTGLWNKTICLECQAESNLMEHRKELPSDWAYMFDASSVACVEYLNASKEYFAKETDPNHLNYTRRFAVALKYTIFVRPCTGKE